MTEEQIALGRRAVACKGWRWMAGMRYQLHPTHPWFRYDGEDCSDDDGNPLPQAPPNLQSRNAIPDLADPATLGCLLALVREAMNDEHASVSWDHAWRAWICEGMHEYERKTYLGVFAQGPSYAEALVAALEAAREAAP